MPTRAFTLLELLIAVALAAALGALAFPALMGRTADARLEAASRQVHALVIRCRAEAMRSGQALSLTYEEGLVRGELVLTQIAADEPGTEDGAREERAGETGRAARTYHAERHAIPAGLTMSLTPPRQEEAIAAAFGAHLPPEFASRAMGGGASEPVRVAIFLPDGSTVAKGPVYLHTKDGGAAVEISVQRWGGAASVRPFEVGGLDDELPGDAPETPSTDDGTGPDDEATPEGARP